MKFKVGDIVIIKELEDMKEFPVNINGEPMCNGIAFVERMNHLCGRKAKITRILDEYNEVLLDFEDKSGDIGWTYTIDMIKPYVFKKSELQVMDIVKLRNGNIRLILPNDYSKEKMATFTPEDGCESYMESYTEDLLYRPDFPYINVKEYDIIAVYRTNNTWAAIHDFFMEKLDIKWTWERNEQKVKELTVEEAAELLKEKFAEYDEVKITM